MGRERGCSFISRKIICCFKPHVISYYACVPADFLRQVAELGFDFLYCESIAEFLKELPDAEIAITTDFKLEWLEKASKLKWIATYAAGKERIPEAALLHQGFKVSFGRFHGKIIAETVLGMMLFTARGLGTAYRLQTREQWCDSILMEQVTILHGKVCLILGMGSIGRHIARFAKTFGMYTIGVKRTIGEPIPEADQVVSIHSLSQYISMADHLVVILPNDPSTDHIIDSALLNRMKPTAAIYNVGRGNCIDETALYQALKNKKLGWACLDVFKDEPLATDSPLRSLPNVLILPHAAAFAPEYFELFFGEFENDLRNYIQGYPA